VFHPMHGGMLLCCKACECSSLCTLKALRASVSTDSPLCAIEINHAAVELRGSLTRLGADKHKGKSPPLADDVCC
jgi:hypothetical protein